MNPTSFNSDPNRLIHEPARLKIMSVLSVSESADFVYLRRETGLTAGNLSVQLTKLEDAGYIKLKKEFVGKVPRTQCSMTQQGKTAFKEYRAYIARLLKSTE